MSLRVKIGEMEQWSLAAESRLRAEREALLSEDDRLLASFRKLAVEIHGNGEGESQEMERIKELCTRYEILARVAESA